MKARACAKNSSALLQKALRDEKIAEENYAVALGCRVTMEFFLLPTPSPRRRQVYRRGREREKK